MTNLLDTYAAYHEAVRSIVCLPREFDVHLASDHPIALVFLSDLHLGGEGVDLPRLRADFARIAADPRVRVSLGGDIIDNFILKGMTSAAQSSDAQVKIQWRLARELLSIIQERVIMLGSGNHDAWTYDVAQIDGVLAALRDWPTVYTGEGGLVRVHLGTQTYRVFRKHVPGRGRNRKHPTNAVVEELFSGAWDFDIGVLEHEHVPAVLQFRHRQCDRIAIRCGTYKVRDSYAETLGFTESASATPTILLFPQERRMVPFLHLEDALLTLDALCPIPSPTRSSKAFPAMARKIPMSKKVAPPITPGGPSKRTTIK